MSEIESGLKEYIEHFGKEIVKNLDELNFYYKHEFIFFCEFRTIIYENLNCLLLGLYQASICMTNHLLERMLKQFQAKTNGRYAEFAGVIIWYLKRQIARV